MGPNQTQRPKFYEDQYLGAADLTAVVDYGRIQQVRHVLGAHTWGIAMGLQLRERELPGNQFEAHVLPGYAWDGFGRPIVVLAPYKIPAELFKSYIFDPAIDNGAPEGRLIEVWLRYDEVNTQNVRPGFEVCGTEDTYSRVQETFRVAVGARPNHIDRHHRITVAGDLIDAQEVVQKFALQTPPVSLFDESVPYQNLPKSDAKARWLIPLGYIRWKPNQDSNQPGNFVKREPQDLLKSRTLRRYIGVVAESVQAADKVLRLRDRTKDYSPVQSDDLVWVEGKLRIEGDASLFGGKLDFRHADGQNLGVPLRIQRAGDSGSGNRALQVIVGPDSQTSNRFAVGPLKADGTAEEKFVVLSGGSVGIGTTAPSHILHVLAKDAVGLFESTTTQAFLRLATSEGLNSRVEITNRPGGRLSLFTSGAGDVFNITRDGNVGIGTINPSHKLHVLTPDAVGLFESTTTQAFLRLATSEGLNNRVEITNRPGGRLSLFTSGAGDVLNITRDGNVGIGTINPTTKLHVVGARIRLENSGKRLDLRADGTAVDLHSETDSLYLRSSGGGGKNKVIINPFGADGDVGIGLENPECKLHVVGNKNESPTSVDSHVAVIENTNGGFSSSVLALKIGTATTNFGNNYLTFFAGSNPEGAIEGRPFGSGVVFNSSGADFAECLARLHTDENIEAGDIVGVFSGKITKTTEAALHVTAITDRPIVLANTPRKDERHLYGETSFVGQVPVKVRGTVREGDFIVPSGLNDGVGIAISPNSLTRDQSIQIVGRAWESSDEEDLKRINTAIGLPSSSPHIALLSLMDAQQEQIEVLNAEVEKLRQKGKKK